MRLVHASLGGKIPAASCYLYFLTPPHLSSDPIFLKFLFKMKKAGTTDGHG
jgi:hypothetical protein